MALDDAASDLGALGALFAAAPNGGGAVGAGTEAIILDVNLLLQEVRLCGTIAVAPSGARPARQRGQVGPTTGPVRAEPGCLAYLFALAARPGEVISVGEILNVLDGESLLPDGAGRQHKDAVPAMTKIRDRALEPLRRFAGGDAALRALVDKLVPRVSNDCITLALAPHQVRAVDATGELVMRRRAAR